MVKHMRKVGIIILIVIILIGLLIGILLFTNIGQEIRDFMWYKISIPQEKVTIEEKDNIKVTYTYEFSSENFDIDVTDKEIINMINSISNKKLDNYSSQIGLAIIGKYTVDLGKSISFKFDYASEDGFIMMCNNEKNFLTKINPEILRKIVEVVDLELTKNIEIFKTDKITILCQGRCLVSETKIEEKTAIEYILNKCKNVYIKEINYEPSIVAPNYEINFNNNVKLLIYSENESGWLLKDGILSKAYGLNVFDTIIKNAFNDTEEKKQMFKTDKITIISPKKLVEVKDENVIEKITTNLIYGTIRSPEWLKTYDIAEEYNTGIKIKINDYEFLISGIKTIGNRYLISKDKNIKLCYPLQNIESYIYRLLGEKEEKTNSFVSIAPYNIPKKIM